MVSSHVCSANVDRQSSLLYSATTFKVSLHDLRLQSQVQLLVQLPEARVSRLQALPDVCIRRKASIFLME